MFFYFFFKRKKAIRKQAKDTALVSIVSCSQLLIVGSTVEVVETDTACVAVDLCLLLGSGCLHLQSQAGARQTGRL